MYNVIYTESIKLNSDYNIKYIIVLYVDILFLYIEILNVGGENMSRYFKIIPILNLNLQFQYVHVVDLLSQT